MVMLITNDNIFNTKIYLNKFVFTLSPSCRPTAFGTYQLKSAVHNILTKHDLFGLYDVYSAFEIY